MAKYSVVDSDELYESEVSWALNNSSPDKPSIVYDLVCFISLYPSFLVPEYHQKRVKSFTGRKGIFFVSPFASEGKIDN